MLLTHYTGWFDVLLKLSKILSCLKCSKHKITYTLMPFLPCVFEQFNWTTLFRAF